MLGVTLECGDGLPDGAQEGVGADLGPATRPQHPEQAV